MTAKRFKIVDDYLVCYDGDCFDLHKPSDIRSLIRVFGYFMDAYESLKEENKSLQNKVKTYKNGNALLKKTLDKEWK